MRVLLSRDIDGAAGDVYYLEMAGISSETKPTANVATGSKFYEVDTDTNYVYDEDSGDWAEAPSVVDDVNDLKNAINDKYTKPQTGIPASDLASGVIPTVHNVPAGGTSGQVLAKNSNTDYDLKWTVPTGGGSDPYGVLAKSIVSIPVDKIISGKYINKTGGENTSGSYTCSDFIEYNYNVLSYIIYNGTIYGEVSCAFYDENKVPVFVLNPDNASQYGITPSRSIQALTIPVPEGTKYVRISYLGTATSALFDLRTIFLGRSEKIPNSLLHGEDVTLVTGDLTYYKVLVKGVVTNSSYGSRAVSDYLEVDSGAYYMITASAENGKDFYAFYDSSKTYVSSRTSNAWNGVIINDVVQIPQGVAYVRVAANAQITGCVLGKCGRLVLKTDPDNTWHKHFLNIAYSNIGITRINTSENFRSACRFGFNACKGDVRITSDNKLVMCHDAGFTFDGNGRITSYDEENATPIIQMTYAECLAKEYSSKYALLDYPKVCSFDEYLDICSEYGITAVITIRENEIETVVQLVIDGVKRHNLFNNCIINSYSKQALSLVHMLNQDIPITYVYTSNILPDEEGVRVAKLYGNMGMVIVGEANMESLISTGATIIQKCNDDNIGLIFAQLSTLSEVNYVRQHGFSGAHITKPVVPYIMGETKFKVLISDSTPTIGWWVGQNLFTVDISVSGNVISLTNFKKSGSTSLYNDEIMELWMNTMPYRITTLSDGGYPVTAKWENNALKITVNDISVDDTLSVIVEV